jgi:alpha-amylase
VKDPDLHHVWRKLQTSDHFYYMCTKWFSDGDVHKYFNPYATPFDAYVAYTNVLNDLAATVESRIRPKGGRRKTHV